MDDEHQKMTRYYSQRGEAIKQITIDNIREGKLKEMKKEQLKVAMTIHGGAWQDVLNNEAYKEKYVL